jgi:nitrate/nitrite-specific signal transduction histidine kinase
MLNLAPLVVLLAASAILAVWALQAVLGNLEQGVLSEDARREAQHTLHTFRWLVLGLAMLFLVLINFSVMILLRMGAMVLRPVQELVDATRELAQGHFEHRVRLRGDDEFGQLAAAFNELAQQLESNEQRKMDVLSQVALMLNHELNNCMAIISLQTRLLSRESIGRPQVEEHLRQIRDGLERMAATVKSLKDVRRIVLTDYAQGVKMLDLKRSVRSNDVDDDGNGDSVAKPLAAAHSA